VIAYESGIADTIDPLGGSYFVESLTNEVERRARDLIAKIDGLGGAVRAIEQRFYQSEIARSAYEYQRAIEESEKIVVGVNRFTGGSEAPVELLAIDEAVSARQRERLARVRASRDGHHVREALMRLRRGAEGTDNLVPHILECVEAYCSVGEISDELRATWGEYQG
jgi:methylmalonyl-CoA mutase N-terminal domain/subunit